MIRPPYGTAPIRCGKTRCAWRGYETDLKQVPFKGFEGIKANRCACPTCGADSYSFMTPGEIKAWERKKGLTKPTPEGQEAQKCGVRGLIRPNAMCGHMIVGGNCGFSGVCQHQIQSAALEKEPNHG